MDEKISIAVITLNEEDNIGRCLESVQWADDVLVVDSGSEDRTVEIAEKHGARVLHRDWGGFRDQKQFATDQAQHDWILNLDADEWLDSTLQAQVQSVLSDPPDATHSYRFNRLSHYMGTWIRFGSWYPEWIIRLFNRTETEWDGREPHVHVNPTEHVHKLDGHLRHLPYESVTDHLDHINTYTSTMAQEAHEEGEQSSPLEATVHAFVAWIKDYWLKLGIRGGWVGFVNSVFHAFYTFMKYIKLWRLQTSDSTSDNKDVPS